MAFRPSRRWFRYSLKTLLVLVTVLGAFLGWLGREANIVRKHKAAIAEIDRAVNFGSFDESKMPFWRRWMGDKVVEWVQINEDVILKVGLERMNEIHAMFPDADICVKNTVGPPEWPRYQEWRAQHPAP